MAGGEQYGIGLHFLSCHNQLAELPHIMSNAFFTPRISYIIYVLIY